MWVRVDNRLVHGQVIEAWLPYTGSKSLVVADDSLADDKMRQTIMSLAIPRPIQAFFVPLAEAASILSSTGADSFLLFADCLSARKAFEYGVCYPCLNIGNLHYSPGKEQVCDHVALGDEDYQNLRYLKAHGVEFDFRCVPNRKIQVRFG